MPISAKTLIAIQSAGAAVYAADIQLKSAVQEYAEQMRLALNENPFDAGNDALFEDWKTVARLSQAMGQIEQELRKIYGVSENLALPAPVTSRPVPVLNGPGTSGVELVNEISAVDVVPKAGSKPGRRMAYSRKVAGIASGNTAKVLAQVSSILNEADFVKVHWSAVAATCGLPKGSIGASVKKLVEQGVLVEGGQGRFKLGKPRD